jgi:hypothetical protein
MITLSDDDVGLIQLDDARTLAAYLRVSVALVRKWSRLADFPIIKCGKACRFDRASVVAWLEARQKGARQQ